MSTVNTAHTDWLYAHPQGCTHPQFVPASTELRGDRSVTTHVMCVQCTYIDTLGNIRRYVNKTGINR